MAINNITQTISTIPEAAHRGVDVQTVFVIKQEDFQDHLAGTTVTELNTLKDQLNLRIGEINSTTTTMNGYAGTASAGASTATTKAGEASTSASDALAYKNQAETFKNNATNSATKASQWADNNYNVEVETGKYSAKHWSTVAQNATANKVDKVTSTDNAVVRFNDVTGDVQNSGVIIDDSGTIILTYSNTDSRGYKQSNGSWYGRVVPFSQDGSMLLETQYAGNGGGFRFNVDGTERMRIDASGNLLLTSGTGGLGYGTGAGGTVTQLTSKSTAVTLNKPSGRIIMHNTALGAGATVWFILSNNLMGSSDTLTLSIPNLIANDIYNYKVTHSLYNGGALIFVTNVTGSTLSEAISINFNVHKGALA